MKTVYRLMGTILIVCGVLAEGQSLPVEPSHESGASVTGAYEGWFKNPDGSFSLLLGYYNRNQKQEIDIPVGPNNRIDPGGPDRGQPTHFLPGRGWGQFTVKVPADFGDKKLTWTLVANGKTTAIPAGLHPDYEISPFVEASVGNTPPALGFDEQGPFVQGPQGMTVERSAKVGTPLPLTLWVSDDAKYTSNSGAKPKVMPPPVVLHWAKFSGPGEVTFTSDHPALEKWDRKTAPAAFNGKAVTSATFSAPGEYVLHVQANDYSGEGGAGFQCCWSNAQVKVTVTR
jgi:hypothetical protein